MENLVFNFKNKNLIKYRFKKSVYDCQHLLIVMSGFNIPDATIYDFSNALSNSRSAILWVKDDFDGSPAYYLCNDMQFEIEQGISLLIKGVIDFVKPKATSILGGSKGGTAALYYGTKLNIKNIITAVPQFNIGSYVASGYWESVGKKMMGVVNEKNIKLLDEYLINSLRKDKHKNKSIYLFTSPSDKQFSTEIEPNLGILNEYENFNLIESKSIHVSEHNQVTGYNLNLILSLIYQLENGITPRFGHVKNGANW
jgi:hypothetical protein